ncbi:uncharacterized protein LOC106152399 [Lingula anatina]|uniref:Uncharacterized protein LOC106152399 n=1 Tax=Lingula anatina TaxID=7574 RepID=A0A2R2MT46_LINAN|nr:uncharacterized protein LOC106152399 [Lingula anatina]|eukprot:XP_023933426.1 uncharacterized protein LOC106152399 [Lingula anatina]
MLIAWQVRETLVGERSSWMDKPKYQWLLHLLAWGVPVLILTAAAADGKLGYWQSSENHTSLIPKTTTVSPNMSMTFFYHETAYPSLDATKPRQDNTVVVAVDGHAENAAFEGGGYSGSKEDLLRGSTAGWCWIKICEGDELHWGLVVFLTLLTGKGWEMVAYIVVPTIYFNIKGKLQRTVLKASASRLDKAVLEAVKKAHRAMTAVPLMFIALRIWGTIRYVANITVWITGSSTEPWFEVLFNKIFLVLHAIGDSGQGLGNSLIYCLLADRVRDNIFRHLCASCCWRRETGLRYSLNLPRDTSMYDESRDYTISEDTTTSHSGSESETSENAPILRQKYDLYT